MSTIKPYDPAACAELVRQARAINNAKETFRIQNLLEDMADALESALHEVEVRDRALNDCADSIIQEIEEHGIGLVCSECPIGPACSCDNECSVKIAQWFEAQARRDLDGAGGKQ